MSDNLKMEVEALRNAVRELEARIESLDKKISGSEAAPGAGMADEPGINPHEVLLPAAVAVVAEEPPGGDEPVGAPSFGEQAPSQPAGAPGGEIRERQGETESLETRIGLYWLNRLGVGSLVIGVALLITYSFQYFGPAAKLCTGFALALLLAGGGEWMERRQAFSWLSRGLIGGGWSLAYFTTYAMHFIQPTRVIDNTLIECLLLIGVACGAILHALRRKSEEVALLAAVLGFLTAPLAGPGWFSVFSSALLSLLSVALSARMGWARLYLWSLVAAYGAYILGLAGKIDEGADENARLLKSAYLVVYWALFNAGGLFLRADVPGAGARVVIATVTNCFVFFCAMFGLAEHALPGRHYLFPLALAAACLTTSRLARDRGSDRLAGAHRLLAVSLITATFPMMVAGDWFVPFWAAEVPVLIYLGLANSLKSLRWFALVLAGATGLGVLIQCASQDAVIIGPLLLPVSCIVASVALLSFALSAFLYTLPRFTGGIGRLEGWLAFKVYALAATIMALMLPALFLLREVGGRKVFAEPFAEGLLVVLWPLEGAATAALGMRCGRMFVRCLSYPVLVVSFFAILACAKAWPPATAAAILVLAATAYGVQRKGDLMGGMERQWAFFTHFFAASLAAWLTLIARYDDPSLPLRLAGLAVSTVGFGFLVPSFTVRLTGAAGFATAGLSLLASASDWNTTAVVLIVGLLYTMAYLYRQEFQTRGGERALADWYSLAGSILLTAVIGRVLSGAWLSLGWAAEGLLLLAVGLILPDKKLRVSGLLVFALVMLKLLFVDLASAETVQRILSFIGAGVVLILSSFFYGTFVTRFVGKSGGR